MARPAVVVVAPIRLTTASWLTSGRPRQFWVMWQNMRCSILFHLLVPGGGVETALTVAAEVGADLSRFPSVKHFRSWLGLSPGTRISGDKRLSGGPRPRSNRLGQALRMAATTARSDKSAIGAMHRRRLARMDTAKAIKATAHHLARLIYAMLTRGEQYVEQDLADWEEERRDRMIVHLQRQAKRFDLTLVSASAA